MARRLGPSQPNDWDLGGGRFVRLLTPAELPRVPDGTVLHTINDRVITKGKDKIDGDQRFGYLACGFLHDGNPPVLADSPWIADVADA